MLAQQLNGLRLLVHEHPVEVLQLDPVQYNGNVDAVGVTSGTSGARLNTLQDTTPCAQQISYASSP